MTEWFWAVSFLLQVFSPYDMKISPTAVEVTFPEWPTQNEIVTVAKSVTKSLMNFNAE